MDARLRRLSFRAWRRGFKEADLVLGRFCDQNLTSLTPEELDQLEALLGEADADLYNWILKRTPVPADHDHALMARLQAFSADGEAAAAL